MHTWADSVADSSAPTAASGRSSYVPPHLRNRAPAPDPPAPAPAPAPAGPRWGTAASRPSFGGPRSTGGWNSRTGGWGGSGSAYESNPFTNDDEASAEPAFDAENTGINFDAYEDIPVEAHGHDVAPPVSTFADIDLGDALNANIRRCKYVRPTPVQRHAIPISLAGRDLMACAQTGSGKTAAFCFPIISGIMKGGQFGQGGRPRGGRTVYPLALILSPTRELSVQIHEEARKFAYQTGVRVVVAYGGAPINQQRSSNFEDFSLLERRNLHRLFYL